MMVIEMADDEWTDTSVYGGGGAFHCLTTNKRALQLQQAKIRKDSIV